MNPVKSKIIGILLFGLVISICIMSLQSKRIEMLQQEKEMCLLKLSKADKQANEINVVNDANNNATIKYNSQKKKDYPDEKDNDLNALHNLDVLLEQKSIIK